MVAPSDRHFTFSPSLSYRTTHLPSPSNNNKIVKSNNYNNVSASSRKRSSATLPPLDKHQTPRSRTGRTVPHSRSSSSKLSRIETGGKRSRSASEEQTLDNFNKDLRISGRAQQITQTVRVLRARSALLLPSPQLNLPPSPLQVQPMLLKFEERNKRR